MQLCPSLAHAGLSKGIRNGLDDVDSDDDEGKGMWRRGINVTDVTFGISHKYFSYP